MLKSLLTLSILLAALLHAAPFPNGMTGGGALPVAYDEAAKQIVFGYEPNQNKGCSSGVALPLKEQASAPRVVVECDVVIGTTSPKGHVQVSGSVYFLFRGQGKARPCGIGLTSQRYHRNRGVVILGGPQPATTPFDFQLGRPIRVRLELDRTAATWRGALLDGGKELYATAPQPLPAGFQPDAFYLTANTVGRNDGLQIRVSPPAVARPEDTAEELLALPAPYTYGGALPVGYSPAARQIVIGYEPHQNKQGSSHITMPLGKLAEENDRLAVSCGLSISNYSPKGNPQVSGRIAFLFLGKDTGKAPLPGLSIGSTRYHHNRNLIFNANGKTRTVPFNFTPGQEMTIRLVFDRKDNTWTGEVHQDGKRLFTTEPQPLPPRFSPAAFLVTANTVSPNDGLQFRLSLPTAAPLGAKDAEQAEEYCSTLPRHYRNVNPALFNSAFASFCGDNLADRIALGDPKAAEARAKQLHDLGFTAVLYNGRHFRLNYREEFPHIAETGRIVREACAKYGISVIEHHDPTIFCYHGYPFMLHHLDWLQRDIRDGESSYWACASNPDFMAYCLDYLARLQGKAQFAGFMIDELNLASRNHCGCVHCRRAYAKATGRKPPVTLNHNNPSFAQRDFRSWGMRMTNLAENAILNALQKVKPDTIIMTYCSDYADPNSQSIDLTQAAALYSPFVGWESMLRNPLENGISFLGTLKSRNSYADFYNIPVWSLNREPVKREAHYVEWAMCQGARHAIWFGRVPLDAPEDAEYFRRYSRWNAVMPHRFARTFTDTALLVSAQTWRTTADRSFYWNDFRGVMETFIRSSRQFDTILDGDLFYPNRLGKYRVLVLASQASLSDKQCRAIEQFVADGGVAIVTGNTSLHDAHGNRRQDFGLARAMNLRHTGRRLGKADAISHLDGTATRFPVPHLQEVEVVNPAKSRVLVHYCTPNGNSLPLAVATRHGKGAFLYLAAQYGAFLNEPEIRAKSRYQYTPHPELAALLDALYDRAHTLASAAAPVTASLPAKVVAIANQLQDGPGKGTIYAQIYNFTGTRAKAGDALGEGIPETLDFPQIQGDLAITVNRPCAAEAVLESPERPDLAVKGIRQGNSTVFAIPGKAIGFFAQLKIASTPDPAMAILEPPLADPPKIEVAASVPNTAPASFYHPREFLGELLDAPPAPARDGFAIDAQGRVSLDGTPVIAGEEFRQAPHEFKDFLRGEALAPAVTRGWRNGEASGLLASGTILGGDLQFVRETTRLNPARAELTLAAAMRPIDYHGRNNIWTWRIPVATLKGATAHFYHGMHRSGRPPRTIRITGDEPDGTPVATHIRHIQFTGGPVDFSIDFSIMGVGGLYSEDLSSQYKAHLIREGDFYVVLLPENSSRYGVKYFGKAVLRCGKTDFNTLHPMKMAHYQYGRQASARLQFTTGRLADGYIINKYQVGFNRDFATAPLDGWEKAAAPVKRVGDDRVDPLYSHGAAGKGPNTYRLAHQNGIALVNVILNGKGGPIRGTVSANGGKPAAFDLGDGETTTAVLPVRITDGQIRVAIDGTWLVSGIVVQPLAYEAEDFLFSRTYWNCGAAPWTIPELKCDAPAWRRFSDIPFRRAKWEF